MKLGDDKQILGHFLLFKNLKQNIQSGVKHTIPISTSFTLLKHINFSPSINYTERWYFKKSIQEWNNTSIQIELDTISKK